MRRHLSSHKLTSRVMFVVRHVSCIMCHQSCVLRHESESCVPPVGRRHLVMAAWQQSPAVPALLATAPARA